MSRALVLGNGTFLVCLDRFGFVRDVYFPYVGLENHVSGHQHRIGVMVNGNFSWINDGSWEISIGYKPETMIGYLVCKHHGLQVSLVMEDMVYNEQNIFMRKMDVYNQAGHYLDFKVFFHQVFLINESHKRNTAFYDPTHNAIVHYKGRRVFIVNGRTERGSTIDDFSVGAYGFDGKQGTYVDAEDGQLAKNGVEHGSVDSVVRFCTSCEGKQKATIHYWICAGKSLEEAYRLNSVVTSKTPPGMYHSTDNFWNAWLNKGEFRAELLTKEQKKMFDTSLFIMRAHTDNRGSIIASADSAMIEYGKDDYSYMWPRDAAFIVQVLDKAGYTEVTKPFFEFCRDVLHEDGYLHHRYNADQSLGSTWHSTLAQRVWLKDRILQLPIQEDETAGVIFALWNHYQHSKDLEFIETMYRPFIEKAATFLTHFRDTDTGLPMPSYDLWEEKIGVSTYTCASVYGGLMAAAKFSELLGKRNHMRDYRQTAQSVKEATIEYLFSSKLLSFVRMATIEDGRLHHDETIDASSLYGLWYYGVLDQRDELFRQTLDQVTRRLSNPSQVGGLLRYERDQYFKATDLSNPWIITTIWEAQRRLRSPDCGEHDLEFARQTMDWVVGRAYPSGVLAEQLNPYSGQSLSATPLVWSHAMYVELALEYCQAVDRLHPTQQPKLPKPIFEL
ncbi:MAG: glycoside hydrolase family 15 [Candidatus Pacebacteria bacterium CG10_big_fil_rev_8_21_14_0_10_56_10]|nr:MAG: glycoside hydrolase family 15 [Candidatus Pacebacteria bacterium CG10_big_fil_rev_8_21_14_0_10_56_10]